MSTLIKLRKTFAAFTLTTLVASLFVVAPVAGAIVPDWVEGIDVLQDVNPVYGDEDQVEADKCRVAAILAAASNFPEDAASASTFTDISEECKGPAGALYARGIVQGEGGDNTVFGAGVEINRATFAAMLSRTFDLAAAYPNASLTANAESELDAMGAEWAKPFFAQLQQACIFQQVRAADTINVYEIVTAVSRTIEGGACETPDEPGVPTPTVGGDLEVTIASNTQPSRTVPGGVQNANIATFELSAGSKDVNLNSIKFTKGGIAADDALESIALFTEEGQRISKARNFNSSDDEATVNILSGGLDIEAGETIRLIVIGEIGSVDAQPDLNGDEFFLEVLSADDVVSNASSVSVDDAKSNTMRIGSADAAELELSQGSSSPDVSIGEQGTEVYEFEMENNATDNTDIIFYGITLEAEGTFDEDTDLSNYELYIDGDMVASTKSALNGFVSFLVDDADGYVIQDNKTVDVVVKADVVSGANETISFGIDSELDVLAADASFGTGAKIAGNITGNTTNIEAGELTLVAVDAEKDEFTQDTDEFILGTIKVTSNAGRNIELQELRVNIEANLTDVDTTTGGAQQNVSDVLENVEAVTPFGTYSLDRKSSVTAAETAAGMFAGAGTTETYEDDSIDILLPEGETFDIVITADILDNLDGLLATDTLELSLNTINGDQTESYFYAEEQDDDEAVTDITPSSLSFDAVDGSVSSLEIKSLTLADETHVVGADDVLAMFFELEAGDSEDITVNEIDVEVTTTPGDFTGANAADNSQISKLALYLGSVAPENLLDTASGSDLQGGAVTFDDIEMDNEDLVIPAGTKREFIVAIDIVDATAIAGTDLQMAVQDVDADDEDNDTVTTLNSAGNPLANGDEEESSKVATLTATGELSLFADNDDEKVNLTKNVLLGSVSDYIAAFEFTAVNEAIEIKELDVTLDGGGGTAIEDVVKSVHLFDEDGNQIAVENVSSDEGAAAGFQVNFDLDQVDNIITIEEGTTSLYVKVNTLPYGKNQAGEETITTVTPVVGPPATNTLAGQITAAMSILDAEGASSGNDVAPATIDHLEGGGGTVTIPSNGFIAASVRLSNVEFVESFGGVTVLPTLQDGTRVLGILKLTAEAGTVENQNTTGGKLELVVEKLLIDVNLSDETALTNPTIQRIGGTTERADLTEANVGAGQTAGTFTDADLGALFSSADDAKIEAGETAYFAIRADVAKSGANDNESVSLSLRGLRNTTETSSITYRSDEPGELVPFLNIPSIDAEIDSPFVVAE